jgi:hypothetical protein
MALVSTALRTTGADTVRWEADGGLVTAEQVDAWFAELGSGRTVLLQDLPSLFTRRPGGFAPLERLVRGIVEDGGANAFAIVADAAVWGFAGRISGLREVMGTVIDLEPLSVEQLEQALLSRHAMSGYDVMFEADEDLGWQLEHVLLRGEDRERRRRRAWFRTLHAASAGVLQDALRLWMAAIRDVDDEREVLRIGAVPRPPLARLEQLPEDVLLTLLETTWQGWMTPALHAQLFRTAAGLSEAHVAQLQHAGLLVREGDVLTLAPHLRGPLDRVLRRRGWA